MHCNALFTTAALALVASTAHAQIATFDLSYAGVAGSTAVGVGSITLDESLINNPGTTLSPSTPFVTAFSLTISGATSGNGTFTLAAFSNFYFSASPGPVDFSQELQGQANFRDFAIFANPGSGAPSPFFIEKFIVTNERSGDLLGLTSFRPAASAPAVPEPGSVALLTGMGTVGAAFLRRRKQAHKAA